MSELVYYLLMKYGTPNDWISYSIVQIMHKLYNSTPNEWSVIYPMNELRYSLWMNYTTLYE